MLTLAHRRAAPVSLALTTLLAAGLLAIPSTAADDDRYRRHSCDDHSSDDDSSDDDGRHSYRHSGHRYGHDRRAHDGYAYPVRQFVVPRVITEHYVDDYAPYYGGSAYFAPHRHVHEIYVFPVAVDGVWHHRPHAYCGGRLYDRHVSFSGRRLSFDVRF